MTIPFNGIKCLNDGFVSLVDHMGNDSAIVNAARISYGKNEMPTITELDQILASEHGIPNKDINLIRYLMRHRHTTPFEMVEFKFIIRIPMDAWRQMIRHRTASVNEYSTRYTEAINSCQTTDPNEWRLQATDNKQGSSGFIEGDDGTWKDGKVLSALERKLHITSQQVYKDRIHAGVTKEQARKDLPLSTYTEAYWKMDLKNLFHFLSLRMDSHAQLEIRTYAKAIAKLIQPIVPIAYKAFEDFHLNAVTFSVEEHEQLKALLKGETRSFDGSTREYKEFKEKLR